MANGDAAFLKIPESSWWKLRDLFKRTVPAAVTPSYLAAGLSMTENSAKANLIPSFKKIGIIDEEGKPTDLAYDWRDDSKYKAVCDSLITNNYPQELRDLYHSPDADIQAIAQWFMNKARCGEAAAKMFSRFYMLLLKADPNGVDVSSKSTKNDPKKPTLKSKSKKDLPLSQDKSNEVFVPEEPLSSKNKSNFSIAPELHINIQLHISPESSADQIDKIFESMAKHLKDFNK